MRITILGRRWNVRSVPGQELGRKKNTDGRWAICDNPRNKNKSILLWQGLEGKDALEYMLHEMIHAAGWHLDETYVEQAAKDFANALYKMGVTWPEKQ